MAAKRIGEDEGSTHQPNRSRTGFKVGPQNLPDCTWRRKVIKKRKELIHKAKVKKSYAKIKSRVPAFYTVRDNELDEESPPLTRLSQEIHPERQAMLDAPSERVSPTRQKPPLEWRRRCRPADFDNGTTFAEEQKVEAEAKRAEFERKDKERLERIKDRERFRKSMAKAKSGGRNGQRKLGRESKALLEKVKRVVES